MPGAAGGPAPGDLEGYLEDLDDELARVRRELQGLREQETGAGPSAST